MSAFNRLLCAGMLGAVIAAGVALATPATVTGQAHPAPSQVRVWPIGAPQEDEPGWDCATMGNRVCGAGVRPENVACWAEKVHGTIEDVEIICGDKGDRPRTDTADIGDTVWVSSDPLDGGREPWVVTVTGLEPDSAN